MANFEALTVIEWYRARESDGAAEMPGPNLLARATNHTAGTPPVVKLFNPGSYYTYGLARFNDTGDNQLSAWFYDPSLVSGVDALSFISFRSQDGTLDWKVGPAVRMNADGDDCYTALLIWNGAGYDVQAWKVTGNVFSGIGSPVTLFGISDGNYQNRFIGLGIRAEGTGASVTVTVYGILLAHTLHPGDPAYGTYVDLNGLNGVVVSPLITYVDSSSPFTGGRHGVKWVGSGGDAEGKALIREWGLFRDIVSARAPVPTLSGLASENGTRVTVSISPGFTVGHESTRYILYSTSSGSQGSPLPIRDTGFLTGNKTSFQFRDIPINRDYYLRFQTRKSDGDISPLSERYFFSLGFNFSNPSQGAHIGLAAAHVYYDHLGHAYFPRDGDFATFDPDSNIGDNDVLEIAHYDPDVPASPGPVIRLASTSIFSAGGRRRYTFTDLGGFGSYDFHIANMSFLRWDAASGVHIGTRMTNIDADGFFVQKKQDSNADYWQYLLYSRQLVSGSPGTGVYNVTTLGTGTLKKTLGSKYGERIIIAHFWQTNTWNLVVLVNGMPVIAIANPSLTFGFGNPTAPGGAAFNWKQSGYMVVPDPSEAGQPAYDWGFQILQYGNTYLAGSSHPQFPIIVHAYDQVPTPYGDPTNEIGIHHTGPYMDPFDGGNDLIWYMKEGKFVVNAMKSTARSVLAYWSYLLPSWTYTVKAKIYGDNGLVARFQDFENYIRCYHINDGDDRIRVEFFVGGSVIATFDSDPITKADGTEMVLQVSDFTAGETTFPGYVLVRAFYDGQVVVPAGSESVAVVNVGEGSPILFGRPGIFKKGGYAAGSPEETFVAADFEVAAGVTTNPPDTPSLIGHSNETTERVSVILTSSEFSDPDAGATHSFSRWQIADITDPSFTSPIFDSGDVSGSLTSILISADTGTWRADVVPGLEPGVTYYARVRHRDEFGLWSIWSSPQTFAVGTPDVLTIPVIETDSFPTYPVPAQAFSETMEFRTLVSTFESGSEQRRAKRPKERNAFRLTYTPLERAQMDILWTFYRTKAHGRLNAFLFTHPVTGIAYRCRFLDDVMSRENFEYALERTGLTLVEVG